MARQSTLEAIIEERWHMASTDAQEGESQLNSKAIADIIDALHWLGLRMVHNEMPGPRAGNLYDAMEARILDYLEAEMKAFALAVEQAEAVAA